MKLVDFSKCLTCKHKDLDENEDPCYECCGVSAREDSHTPIKYEAIADGKS